MSQLKYKIFLISLVMLGVSLFAPGLVYADTSSGANIQSCHPSDPKAELSPDLKAACADSCHPEWHDPPGDPLTAQQLKSCQACNNSGSEGACLQNNVLIKDIQKIVDVMSAGVGVVITGSIIFAGIQYSFAGDNSALVSKAKHRILNSIIALIIFMLLFAFVQWLVPGGVFS